MKCKKDIPSKIGTHIKIGCTVIFGLYLMMIHYIQLHYRHCRY